MPDQYEVLPMLTRREVAAGDTATVTAAWAAAIEAEQESPSLPIRTAACDYCRGLVAADPAPLLTAADSYRSSGRPLDRAQALEDAAVLLARRGDAQAA